MGVLGRYDDVDDNVVPAQARKGWRYDDSSSDSESQSGMDQDTE